MEPDPKSAPEEAGPRLPTPLAIVRHAANHRPHETRPSSIPNNSDQSLIQCTPSENKTQVKAKPVEDHIVLGNEHLLDYIVSFLQHNNAALKNLVATCKFFRHVSEKVLWQAADLQHLVTHVSSVKRQQELAAMIKEVEFSNCEAGWPSAVHDCPNFSKIDSLRILNTSLSVDAPEQLKPFLKPSLRELVIWTWTESDTDQGSQHRRDSLWMSQLSEVCFNLSSLKLEVALNVSSAEMTSLLTSMPHLRNLWLGAELNAALSFDTLTTIFTLPRLDDLSLEFPLDSSFLDEFLDTERSREFLPRVLRLDIKVSESEYPAPGKLLSAMSTLEEFTISFKPATGDQVVVPHSDFLQCISTLPALRALTMYLSSVTPLTVPALSSMVSHKGMKCFNISSPPGNQFIPKPAQISLTADDIIRAPIDFKFLQALDLVHIQSPIVVTYDEAVQITEKINQVSPSYMVLFELRIDEEASFGWPSVRDYEAVLEDTTPLSSVWKGSLRAFAPDPVGWQPRDLKIHVNKHGKVIPLEDLVFNGQYNHIG